MNSLESVRRLRLSLDIVRNCAKSQEFIRDREIAHEIVGKHKTLYEIMRDHMEANEIIKRHRKSQEVIRHYKNLSEILRNCKGYYESLCNYKKLFGIVWNEFEPVTTLGIFLGSRVIPLVLYYGISYSYLCPCILAHRVRARPLLFALQRFGACRGDTSVSFLLPSSWIELYLYLVVNRWFRFAYCLTLSICLNCTHTAVLVQYFLAGSGTSLATAVYQVLVLYCYL